jgi:Protein of unknown function (DUF998)
VVSTGAAPVLLVSGWTVAARLRPGASNAVASSGSAHAAQGAADRWVMTFTFLIAGACRVATSLALSPAASAGRLVLLAGLIAPTLQHYLTNPLPPTN